MSAPEAVLIAPRDGRRWGDGAMAAGPDRTDRCVLDCTELPERTESGRLCIARCDSTTARCRRGAVLAASSPRYFFADRRSEVASAMECFSGSPVSSGKLFISAACTSPMSSRNSSPVTFSRAIQATMSWANTSASNPCGRNGAGAASSTPPAPPPPRLGDTEAPALPLGPPALSKDVVRLREPASGDETPGTEDMP